MVVGKTVSSKNCPSPGAPERRPTSIVSPYLMEIQTLTPFMTPIAPSSDTKKSTIPLSGPQSSTLPSLKRAPPTAIKIIGTSPKINFSEVLLTCEYETIY